MISSTIHDLPEHREKVKNVCMDLAMFPTMMEHLPASDADAIRVSLELVDQADIYLGIFAYRYGHIPEGNELSITEMEYNRAVSRGIPRLIFLMHHDHPLIAADVEKGAGAVKLEALKKRLRTERTVKFFKSSDELGTQVLQSLVKLPQSEPLPQKPDIVRVFPLTDISYFTGRVSELALLENLILKPQFPPVIGLWGSPGIGKSALAHYFARKFTEQFPGGIIGLDTRNKDALKLALNFATLIGQPVDSESALEPSAIMQLCFANRRTLLIMDNAERTEIKKLIPGGCSIVIITTRDRELLNHLGLPPEAQISLERFDGNESIDFLRAMLGVEVIQAEENSALELIQLVQGLPLALRIAGATLRGQLSGGHFLKKYVTELRDAKNRLRRLQWRDDEELNVRAVFRLSLPHLKPEEQQTFACLAACAESGFALPAAAATAGPDIDDAGCILARLVNLALIDYDQDSKRFQFHPLLYLFARDEAQERRLLAEAGPRYANFFTDYVQKRQALNRQNLNDLELEQDAILDTARWKINHRDWDVSFWQGLRNLLEYKGLWQIALDLIQDYLELTKNIQADSTAAYFHLQTGKYALLLGKFDQAIAAYERSLAIGEELGDRRHIGMVLNSFGGALQARGRFDQAIAAFERSITIREELGDQRSIGMVLNSLGGALQAKGQFDQAIAAFERSLTIREELDDRRSIGMVLNSLGGALQAKGQFDQAIAAFERSLAIGEELGDRRGIGMILNSLGGALQAKGQFDQAITAYECSLAIGEDLGDRRHIGMVLNSLGRALQAKGQFDQAITAYERSLAIGEDLGDRRHIGMILNSLGGALQAKGQFDQAIAAFERSLVIGEELGDRRHIGMVLNSLGGALQARGQFDQAIAIYERSLAIGEELGDQRSIGMVLNSLGGAFLAKGQFDQAIAVFERSLTIREELGDQRSIGMVLNSLGGVLQAKGQFDQAIAVFERSLAIREEMGDRRGIGMILNSLGGALLAKGHFDQAIAVFERSLTIREELGDRRSIAIVLNSLGGALQAKGQFDQAITAYERSLAIWEELNDQRNIGMVCKRLAQSILNIGKKVW
jgi:tetratricopeptide (TPR) repeat protein